MSATIPTTPVILGVSLKMYFGHQETLDWFTRISQIAAIHPAVSNNLATLFVLPSMPTLGIIGRMLSSTKVGLGAQDLYHQDKGAFTGEVGGAMLKELGCKYVEIGHAERRRLFGETDHDVALKVAAAVRNDLIPVLCVGEQNHVSVSEAAELCINQIRAAGSVAQADSIELLVAYEPVWAIGADSAAPDSHIIEVCALITEFLDSTKRFTGSRVIYGGSAGPGLLTRLHGNLAGLFLGRFAHDPDNIVKILDEVMAALEVEASSTV
jgi:triosephosphate isomerase